MRNPANKQTGKHSENITSSAEVAVNEVHIRNNLSLNDDYGQIDRSCTSGEYVSEKQRFHRGAGDVTVRRDSVPDDDDARRAGVMYDC